MRGDEVRVFITAYALSKGIYEAMGERCGDEFPNMVRVSQGGGFAQTFHVPDWHESLDAAVAHANLLRDRRIASLKKQLAKLEKTPNIKVKLLLKALK